MEMQKRRHTNNISEGKEQQRNNQTERQHRLNKNSATEDGVKLKTTDDTETLNIDKY